MAQEGQSAVDFLESMQAPQPRSAVDFLAQAPQDPSIGEYLLGVPGRLGRSFGRALIAGGEAALRVQQMAAAPSSFFGPPSAEPDLITQGGNLARNALEAVNPVPASTENAPPGLARTLGVELPEAVGSTLGLSAATILGGPELGLASAALSQGGQVYRDAKESGADDARAFAAMVLNLPVGALDALEGATLSRFLRIGKVFAGVNEATKGGLAALLKSAGKTAGYEAGTEGIQQLLENAIAAHVAKYQEDRPLMDGVLKSIALGGVVGLGGGAVAAKAEQAKALPEHIGRSALEYLDSLTKEAPAPTSEPTSATASEMLGPQLQATLESNLATAEGRAQPSTEQAQPSEIQPQPNELGVSGPEAAPASTETAPAKPTPFAFPEETTQDRIYSGIVDDLERGKRLSREAPTKIGGGESAEEALSLTEGRKYGAKEEVRLQFTEPLKAKLAENGVTLEQAGDFLLDQHAPTYNEVATRPEVTFDEEGRGQMRPPRGRFLDEELPDGTKQRRFMPWDLESNPASGIPTSEAKALVEKALNGPKAEFYRWLQKWNRRLNDYRMTTREEGGLIRGLTTDEDGNIIPSTRVEWESLWGPDFVHMKTAPAADEERSPYAVGNSFNVRGEESQARSGRSTKADNPIVFGLMSAQQAGERAQLNRVGNLLAATARANPSPSWRVTDTLDGMQPNEKALWFKENGEQRYLITNDKGLGEMFTRLQSPDPGVVKLLDPINSYLHRVIIQWNPVFPLYNAPKDILTAAIKHAIRGDARATASVLVHSIPAMRGAWNVVKDENATGYWEERYKQMRKAGGVIGWAQNYDYGKQVEEFESAQDEPSKAQKYADLMEKLNRAVELGPRLVTFDALLRGGATETQAAIQARRITADFARRGRWAPIYRRLWLFSGANVQGTAEMLSSLKANPKRAATVIGALTGAGFMQALMSYAFGDEDELRKLSEQDKSRFFGVLLGKKRYGLPSPWGFSVFPYLGWKLADLMTGRSDMAGVVGGVGSAALSSFSPLPAAANISQALSPSVLRPFVEVEQNQDFAGRPIMPPVDPYDLSPPPDYTRFFRSTSGAAKALTEGLYKGTAGLVDVSPATIDHLTGAITGGVGSTAGRAFEVMRKVVTGDAEHVRLSDIPGVRAYIQQSAQGAETRVFYENLTKVDAAQDKKKRKEALSASDLFWLRVGQQAKNVKSHIDDMKEMGVPEDSIDQVRAAFNRSVEQQRRAR